MWPRQWAGWGRLSTETDSTIRITKNINKSINNVCHRKYLRNGTKNNKTLKPSLGKIFNLPFCLN
jgi:hypothetical protein